MYKYLCISLCLLVLCMTCMANQGRNVRLNPYTMKYIQQMMSRGNSQKVSNNYRPRASNSQPPKISLQPMKSSKLTIQPLGVKPLLVKPVYGKTYLNVGNKGNAGNAGKYTFAQVQQKPTSTGKKINPIMVALPNLGNLLYKYAKKQVENRQTPVYNQNLYHMFGRQTYGPMPVPTGSTYTGGNNVQQKAQQSVSYTPTVRTSYSPPAPSVRPSYTPPSPAPIQSPPTSYNTPVQRSGYNDPMVMMSGYQQPASVIVQQPQPMMYSSGQGTGNIHIGGGYGDGAGSDWGGGMLYISGPADEIVNVMQQKNHVRSISSYTPPVAQSGVRSISSYTPPVAQSGYGQTSKVITRKTGSIGAGTTCTPVPTNFCHNRKPGHFTSPGSRHCFIQCDAFGRGYNKECAPGTTWNVRGPEPALYNMCS